ncbi:MAG TPA: hypothetical protein VJ869_01230 [Sphaerochaeta sp.]|nr:hypothetical protein [Sphaerochaeta sp.]
MGMKSKVKPQMLGSKTENPRLVVKDVFPKAICLEYCQTTVISGYEKDVIETLKAFSNKNKFDGKKPHLLHRQGGEMDHFFKTAKQKCGTEKVYSLDVKERKDTKRLFYCKDENTGTIKILTLCSEKSH